MLELMISDDLLLLVHLVVTFAIFIFRFTNLRQTKTDGFGSWIFVLDDSFDL